MTLRCALYARYSSDQQRAASIEDQFWVCRERATREGWKVVGAYKDSAISGDSMILRPGIQALLEDARRGSFEIVVAEALDRVVRDQADVATLYKHLRFAGVMIVTLSEGEINELHVGLKGTMNALFLKDLAAKIHRGLRGRVEQGRSGGGLCYGYDVVKSFDGSGDPVRGGRTVNETEAEVVRRVFREFASGASPRAIARRLNGEGISGPSGKLWTDSTIRGHAKRGTGLINNELYIGRLVWNRLRYVKKGPDRALRAHARREVDGDGRCAAWRSRRDPRMGGKRARKHKDRHPHAGDVGLGGFGGRIRICDFGLCAPVVCLACGVSTRYSGLLKSNADHVDGVRDRPRWPCLNRYSQARPGGAERRLSRPRSHAEGLGGGVAPSGGLGLRHVPRAKWGGPSVAGEGDSSWSGSGSEGSR